MYANGQGVPKDEAEAVNWYRKAADQGSAVAQFTVCDQSPLLSWLFHGCNDRGRANNPKDHQADAGNANKHFIKNLRSRDIVDTMDIKPNANIEGSGVQIFDGKINTEGGDIVGGDKFVGLSEHDVIAVLERKGHLAGLPLWVARRVVEGFEVRARSMDAERIESVLIQKAEEYRALKTRLHELDNFDSTIRSLHHEASQLIDVGEFSAADARLAEAEKRDLEAAIQQEEYAKRRRHSAAQSRGARGDAALLRISHEEAAKHFAEAARIVGVDDPQEYWIWQGKQADALASYGDGFGEPDALRKAVELLHDQLRIVSPEQFPVEWSTTQHNLGVALRKLGERTDDAALLESAVTAFYNALAIRTRELNAYNWANTWNSLGTALSVLGGKDIESRRLIESVEAFRTALTGIARENEPLLWATVTANIGAELTTLAEREYGTARLEQAIEVYDNALMEDVRSAAPSRWATTQDKLGITLWRLGDRKSDPALFQRAINAHKAALTELTPDRAPIENARIQQNMAVALSSLGAATKDPIATMQALDAYRSALKVITREREPSAWAAIMDNLGLVLRALGEQERSAPRLREAVSAHQAALEIRTRERAPLNWAYSLNNLVDKI
jgi:tetratricopeptide (TPR) repeat protein